MLRKVCRCTRCKEWIFPVFHFNTKSKRSVEYICKNGHSSDFGSLESVENIDFLYEIDCYGDSLKLNNNIITFNTIDLAKMYIDKLYSNFSQHLSVLTVNDIITDDNNNPKLASNYTNGIPIKEKDLDYINFGAKLYAYKGETNDKFKNGNMYFLEKRMFNGHLCYVTFLNDIGFIELTNVNNFELIDEEN